MAASSLDEIAKRAPLADAPSGFLLNDPEHAPFGLDWLRGITPLRLGAVVLVSLGLGFRFHQVSLAHEGVLSGALLLVTLRTFVYTLSGLPMLFLVVRAERRSRRMAAPQRITALTAAVIVGAGLSASVITGEVFLEEMTPANQPLFYDVVSAQFFRALIYGSILTAVLYLAAREIEVERRTRTARAEKAQAERAMREARVRALQAQIEPHFVFNCLASVRRLLETEPPAAAALIRDIVAYLRAAIPGAGLSLTTLGAEADLAHRYLSIFAVRMGERLQFSVDVPAQLREIALPPLMVATLLENAVKHGIGARARGGSVALNARAVPGFVEVTVSDDGVGFSSASGHGIGLANVRARLIAAFGDANALRLERSAEGGIAATIRVPWAR